MMKNLPHRYMWLLLYRAHHQQQKARGYLKCIYYLWVESLRICAAPYRRSILPRQEDPLTGTLVVQILFHPVWDLHPVEVLREEAPSVFHPEGASYMWGHHRNGLKGPALGAAGPYGPYPEHIGSYENLPIPAASCSMHLQDLPSESNENL